MGYKTIRECRACGNPRLETIIDLGSMALTGYFPKMTAGSNSVPRAPLELVKCVEENPSHCGLIQLKHTYELSELYGDSYGYRSSLNPSMVRHLSGIARRASELISVEAGDLFIDIGSNDGTLLHAYERQFSGQSIQLIGVDPLANRYAEKYPIGSEAVGTFFPGNVGSILNGRKAKVISSIAMFYDLEDPVAFAVGIASHLKTGGVWIFEQSYLPKMIELNSYDTICHEHLEYYGLKQIRWILDQAHLEIKTTYLTDTNGGSILVVAGHKNDGRPAETSLVSKMLSYEHSYINQHKLNEFKRNVQSSAEDLKTFLDQAQRSGLRIFGMGASTKGNVILQYAHVNKSELIAIAEVNADKFDCMTPGSEIPIWSEEDVMNANPDALLVLPWHFRKFFLHEPSRLVHKTKKLIFPLPSLDVVPITVKSQERLDVTNAV